MSRIESDLIVAGTVSADDPTLATHLATKNYVDTNVPSSTGTMYLKRIITKVQMPGAMNATPFDFDAVTVQSGDNSAYLNFVNGGVTILQAGWYQVDGWILISQSDDSFSVAATGPAVYQLAANDVLKPFLWVLSITGSIGRAFGGVRVNGSSYIVPNSQSTSVTTQVMVSAEIRIAITPIV